MYDCRRRTQGNSTGTVSLSTYLILNLKKHTKKKKKESSCCTESTQEKVFENTAVGKQMTAFLFNFPHDRRKSTYMATTHIEYKSLSRAHLGSKPLIGNDSTQE